MVGAMNAGGVETWLMNILRNIDRNRYRMDFLVHTDQPGVYDEEIRNLGSQVIPCLHPRRPLAYARNFVRCLRHHGSYDLIHSHVHLFSGYVVQLARSVGVACRISHSHNDTSRQRRGPMNRLYRATMRRWLRQHSTARLACSRQAAAALYGDIGKSERLCRVVSYGRDLSPFRSRIDKSSVRAELGIPADAFVVGHVGNFTEQKNYHSAILSLSTFRSMIGRSLPSPTRRNRALTSRRAISRATSIHKWASSRGSAPAESLLHECSEGKTT